MRRLNASSAASIQTGLPPGRRAWRTLDRVTFGLCMIMALQAGPVAAKDRSLTLAAPSEMAESGFLKYLLPRFSLKHGVRVTVVAPDAPADVSFAAAGADGRPAFDGDGVTYRVVAGDSDVPDAVDKFTAWLLSDAGQAAVAGFERDGAAPYGPPSGVRAVVAEVIYDGNALDGEKLSLGLCGRCHVVGEINRLSGIGSTPSFGVLRTMADWENRFVAFYVLKPHAAFTQVLDVTRPFPPETPSPIAPIEMTLDDLDNIVAYVAQMPPADLGAPIEHQ
ncbi:MAG: hypothetical protein AAGB05_12320 [Pseudomonadota bacterium]